jgi:hypothetical protein
MLLALDNNNCSQYLVDSAVAIELNCLRACMALKRHLDSFDHQLSWVGFLVIAQKDPQLSWHTM